jgi:PadR family transcriptional regulator, regulatory protein AphA
MSLRHSVLGLLVIQPSTGYELAQRFDRTLSNAWHAGHSQIYPELAKLQEAGMVEVVGEGARRSRTYGATERGREELVRWMTEEEPNRSQRSEGAVRAFLLALVPPEQRRPLLERDLAYVAAELEHLQEIESGMPADQPFRPTVELGLRVNAVMRDWLQEQLDRS